MLFVFQTLPRPKVMRRKKNRGHITRRKNFRVKTIDPGRSHWISLKLLLKYTYPVMRLWEHILDQKSSKYVFFQKRTSDWTFKNR